MCKVDDIIYLYFADKETKAQRDFFFFLRWIKCVALERGEDHSQMMSQPM